MKLKTKVKFLSAIACLSVFTGSCTVARALDSKSVNIGLKHSRYWTEEKIDDFLRTKPTMGSSKQESHDIICSIMFRYATEMRNGRRAPKTILPRSKEEQILVQLCKLVARSSTAGLDTSIYAENTLLHIAARFDCITLARILLNPTAYGISAPPANIDAKTVYRENTPLILAKQYDCESVANYLISNGAATHVLNKLQKTAADHSVKRRHYRQRMAFVYAKQIRERKIHLFTEFKEHLDTWVRQLDAINKSETDKMTPESFVDIDQEIDAYFTYFSEQNADIGGINAKNSTNSTLLHLIISYLHHTPTDVPADTRYKLMVMIAHHLAQHGFDPKNTNMYNCTFSNTQTRRYIRAEVIENIQKQFTDYAPNLQTKLEELAGYEQPHTRSGWDNLRSELLAFITRYASSHHTENGINYQDRKGNTILHTVIEYCVSGKIDKEYLVLFCDCLNELGINTDLKNKNGKTALETLRDARTIEDDIKQNVCDKLHLPFEIPHAYTLDMDKLRHYIETLPTDTKLGDIQMILQHCKVIDERNRVIHSNTALAALREAIRILDNDAEQRKLSKFFQCLLESGLPAEYIQHCDLSDKAMAEFLKCVSDTHKPEFVSDTGDDDTRSSAAAASAALSPDDNDFEPYDDEVWTESEEFGSEDESSDEDELSGMEPDYKRARTSHQRR